MNTLPLILSACIVLFLGAWAVPLDDDFEASKARGKEVYYEYCVTCHMAAGEGITGAFPPLAGSDYLMADVERAARVIKFGQQGEIVVNGVTYNSYMAPLGLDDEEIADVMNFVMNSWGNVRDTMVTETFVEGVEK